MRKVYKAGEQIMVDHAGLTMKYMEGKVERDAYVFVAILPASSYLYVEVFRDMAQQSWIDAHVNAFEYFGGTTKLLVPDNAKTAVIKAKYYDPELNKTYHEMAIHYRSAIVLARSCKPKDKAPVENGVLITERKIIAPLSYKTFLTFNELHDAVSNALEVLNNAPFQKQDGCRRSLFLETEKSQLQALPVNRYEYATWKTAKVNFDYHVCYDKNQFYSVPYQHVGKTVQIRATSRIIEVFLEGERVACHIRNYNAYQHYTTDILHMPEKHKVMTEWTPERFLIWAGKTGEHTREYIQYLMDTREQPQQAFKTCAGILRLGTNVSKELMEQTCEYAKFSKVYSYKSFSLLLKNKSQHSEPVPIQHANIRGSEYFGGTSTTQGAINV
jgi:transposase